MEIELNEQKMQDFIREAYYQNFDLLRLETGIALSPEVKQAGLMQALFYWQKMREVALNVSETEVRLSLPGQESPKEREFGIEGVVDIVREGGKTIIYDIKTHNSDYVRSHINLYEDQLNVYAHIWKELQKQPLDGTALICTEFPDEVKDAFHTGDELQLQRTLERWDPLIEIEFDRRKVKETIRSFGEVVDQIEDHEFAPPSVEKLRDPFADSTRVRFGTHVCRNCDARFSCDAYRVYVRHGHGRAEQVFQEYYRDLEVSEPLEEWRTAGMDAMIEPEELI
ncbi:MAG: PD-(D/E)XK nuclease family protein [Anaerolineaceae bacterium]|jgi:hypothetical protein|nr:PD-(D/E)XK nuclease family protein [Anaerolineaceae bacterium]